MQIYRNDIPSLTLAVTKDAAFQQGLMGEHKIVVSSLKSPNVLDLQIGDWVLYEGVRYTINTVPNYQKIEHTQHHRYDITFEAPIYSLYDKLFMFEGEMEFSYFGSAWDYLTLLISNVNETDTGWQPSEVAETDPKHLDFDSVSCRVALTQIAEAFGLEWGAENKTIGLKKQIGQDRDIAFEYGKGKGLYSLSRQYVQDKNVVTRVFGKGGTRNLPQGYLTPYLRLPAPLEANTELYGIKEGIYQNEDIYPSRTGTVTAVGALNASTDTITLQDISLDFDINDHLAAGITAKIGFQDGELAGYEFEISAYSHTTKTITYIRAEDTATGQIMPNENFLAAVGDKYRLFDIYLPQSYVDAAMTKLDAETEEFLQASKYPQVLYGLNIDVLHFKRMGWSLKVGDRVRLIDSDINLDVQIRVTQISHPVSFPGMIWNGMSYEVEIANFVPYTVQERLVTQATATKRAVRSTQKAVIDTVSKVEEQKQVTDTIISEGIIMPCRIIYASTLLLATDGYVTVYNPVVITLHLPANPKQGKAIYVRRMENSNITFNGNGKLIANAGEKYTVFSPSVWNIGDLALFVYNGVEWCYNWMYRDY